MSGKCPNCGAPVDYDWPFRGCSRCMDYSEMVEDDRGAGREYGRCLLCNRDTFLRDGVCNACQYSDDLEHAEMLLEDQPRTLR